jgi:hypothetical protein
MQWDKRNRKGPVTLPVLEVLESIRTYYDKNFTNSEKDIKTVLTGAWAEDVKELSQLVSHGSIKQLVEGEGEEAKSRYIQTDTYTNMIQLKRKMEGFLSKAGTSVYNSFSTLYTQVPLVTRIDKGVDIIQKCTSHFYIHTAEQEAKMNKTFVVVVQSMGEWNEVFKAIDRNTPDLFVVPMQDNVAEFLCSTLICMMNKNVVIIVWEFDNMRLYPLCNFLSSMIKLVENSAYLRIAFIRSSAEYELGSSYDLLHFLDIPMLSNQEVDPKNDNNTSNSDIEPSTKLLNYHEASLGEKTIEDL